MMAKCCLKSDKLVENYLKNETKCLICKSTVFKVDRIRPGLIRLICETCGEPHMIGADADENGTNLLFWDSETEQIQ